MVIWILTLRKIWNSYGYLGNIWLTVKSLSICYIKPSMAWKLQESFLTFSMRLMLHTYTLKTESESRPIMSNSLQPHGLYSPWNSLDQNTGEGSLFLLQGRNRTRLPNCRRILYQPSHCWSMPENSKQSEFKGIKSYSTFGF